MRKRAANRPPTSAATMAARHASDWPRQAYAAAKTYTSPVPSASIASKTIPIPKPTSAPSAAKRSAVKMGWALTEKTKPPTRSAADRRLGIRRSRTSRITAETIAARKKNPNTIGMGASLKIGAHDDPACDKSPTSDSLSATSRSSSDRRDVAGSRSEPGGDPSSEKDYDRDQHERDERDEHAVFGYCESILTLPKPRTSCRNACDCHPNSG